jgi:NAD(P)-dependent dehydrogenase (short-subunit alcohol dehydrogenase family)
MTDGLQGKVVLVTGGASGLGRMIAESLLADGARVIITSRRRATDVAAELASDGRCIGVDTELTADGAIDRLAEAVRARSPALHAVINNAGRTWGAPIGSFPDSAWRDVLDLNVRVPFAVVQRLLPLLEAAASAADPARVVNIGSVAGTTVQALSAFSYSASKAALHHLSRELAATLASRHITVNTIVPGFFETKMTAHIRGDEQASGQVLRSIPLGRFGRAEDIGAVARFLLSPGATYITGAEIPVDGGLCGCR